MKQHLHFLNRVAAQMLRTERRHGGELIGFLLFAFDDVNQISPSRTLQADVLS